MTKIPKFTEIDFEEPREPALASEAPAWETPEKIAVKPVYGPDDLKGQAIAAFVTLEGGRKGGDELKNELRAHVAKEIGALAKPDDIRFTDALPKTRSGKIMRRLLREIAGGSAVAGDVTTLEDHSVLEKLREDEE